MEQFCDLHAHTVFSDGTLTPAQLLEEAERIGLAAVALTDHNTVAGLPDFLEEADSRDILAVAGSEFSVEYEGRELHILGLFLPPEHFSAVTEKLEEGVRAKEKSNRDLAMALNREGYEIDYEALRAASPKGQLNRAHFAMELVRRGYVADRQAAFDTLLSPKGGLYQIPRRPGFAEIISFIHSLGGAAVLAHPFLDLKEEGAVRAFLRLAVPCGLDGMEVLHPAHSPQQQAMALALTRTFGILPSGGSDFHGGNKPGIRLGFGRGEQGVPLQWCLSLKEKTGMA